MHVYKVEVTVENENLEQEQEVHFECANTIQEVFEAQRWYEGYELHELVSVTKVIESVVVLDSNKAGSNHA